MRLKVSVYGTLVNRVPEIRKKYHSVRDRQATKAGRLWSWLVLIGLNLAWLFGVRDFGMPDGRHPDKGKKQPAGESESGLSFRESPEKLAESLGRYDVISFDVFDTLVFRPFDRPADLFFLVGEKLGYLDFVRIRVEAEQKVRERCLKENGHAEVTLADIYGWLERHTGIPAHTGMRLETETELALCYANPYMKEVIDHLKNRGKQIIAVSDMYLPKTTIRKIAEKCGYEGISAYFVSCEHGCSKGDGKLYRLVRKKMGEGKSFVHVGDNRRTDVEIPRRAGWSASYYPNVNETGRPYRTEDMSIICGSVYRGLVNAHIHNGLRMYDRDYEYGFICGGIFVLGYCRFIHEYVHTHEIDKILFLSRDGDILNQVYQMLYPEDVAAGLTEYVLWSRLAAVKMSAEYYKYDYFRRFLYHKVNQGYTLEEIFSSMELTDMLENFLNSKGGNEGRRELLGDDNIEKVRKFLTKNWEEVLAHYKDQLERGKQYYGKVLKGIRKAVAVDVGWAGSGAVSLNRIVNHIWRMDCEIIGLIAGTNTCNNAEPDMSEAQLYNGSLVSYLYSQAHNRDLWKRHDAARGDNVMLEKLLSSPKYSFRGFYGQGEGIAIQVQEEREKVADTEQAASAKSIQMGILDYCRLYQGNAISSYGGKISGRDAAAPVYLWIDGSKKRIKHEDIACVLR